MQTEAANWVFWGPFLIGVIVGMILMAMLLKKNGGH